MKVFKVSEIKDSRGDTIVIEAAIVFPIMCMIFTALCLLAIYLPQRSLLQEAAQIAAVAIATDRSDTWISFDAEGTAITRPNVSALRIDSPDVFRRNVYVAAFSGANSMLGQERAEEIVNHVVGNGFLRFNNSSIEVERRVANFLIYKAVTVTVTQTIPVPINLSFIGFPAEIVLVQEARAIVSNGDEFVRNVDIAKDLVAWIRNRINDLIDFEEAIDFANKPELQEDDLANDSE